MIEFKISCAHFRYKSVVSALGFSRVKPSLTEQVFESIVSRPILKIVKFVSFKIGCQ